MIDPTKLYVGCKIYVKYEGETYQAVVGMIDEEEKEVGVYVPYAGGQDLIPFDKILLIHEN